MVKQFKVPFNDKGQVTNQDYWQHVVELKDNYVFDDIMKYKGWHAGRSSAIITWEGKDGKTYQSGMQLLNDSLLGLNHSDSVCYLRADTFSITGKFTFRKQGTAVLLTLSK